VLSCRNFCQPHSRSSPWVLAVYIFYHNVLCITVFFKKLSCRNFYKSSSPALAQLLGYSIHPLSECTLWLQVFLQKCLFKFASPSPGQVGGYSIHPLSESILFLLRAGMSSSLPALPQVKFSIFNQNVLYIIFVHQNLDLDSKSSCRNVLKSATPISQSLLPGMFTSLPALPHAAMFGTASIFYQNGILVTGGTEGVSISLHSATSQKVFFD